jgi:putative hemolysin
LDSTIAQSMEMELRPDPKPSCCGKIFRFLAQPLNRLLCLERARELYCSISTGDSFLPLADRVLTHLGISYRLLDLDRARIPKNGPLIAVGNHPFGAVEGLVLASILQSIRPDTKILANYLLEQIDMPAFRNMFIFVDPFDGSGRIRRNVGPLRATLQWLSTGGVLGIFPSGEVSHLHLRKRQITDPRWSSTLSRMVRRTKASVLPFFFEGRNSILFQLVGLIHPRLRTAMLPRETLNKGGKEIRVRIGKSVPFDKLSKLRDDEEITEYLRMRTYMLGNYRDGTRRRTVSKVRGLLKTRSCRAIEPPRNLKLVPGEVEAIPPKQVLIEADSFRVFHAESHQIPFLLHEIGRQREITFREADEGTGKAIDLDDFDRHYTHLVLWNKDANELVGAYRIGLTDRILRRHGCRGLYTSSLFTFAPRFLQEISPAMELGRSFVRKEYQKSYQPLMLLWHGIGRYLSARPQYKVLFGPVSIGSHYHGISRDLIVAFSKNHHRVELAQYVKGNRPPKSNLLTKRLGLKSASGLIDKVQDLSELISCLDPSRRGLPILLKHYLKFGGKFLGFSIDPDFSNVMDALIIVDLTQTSQTLLERYMGREGADSFLRFHNLVSYRACA